VALPEGFSPWEHFQTVLMQVQNRIVRNEFSDVGDDDWEEEIITPRASLRVASTMRDDDSAILSLLKLMFFYVVLRKARDMHPAMYVHPVTSYQQLFRLKPQVTLYFAEDSVDVEPGYDPIDGEMSFRMMHETATTVTMAEVQAIANRIKTLFSSGNGFVWRKGKISGAYTDHENGYMLRVLGRDRTEVKRVIEQFLDINNHSPQWKRLKWNENDEPSVAYPTIPPTQMVLGKPKKLPRYRPIADVRFRYAVMHLHGGGNPIVLVDRTDHYENVIAS